MNAAGDGADEVEEGDTGIDERESGCIDTCLEKTPILLQYMYEDVDLRARI